MSHPLDRPVWNMLTGPQASLAVERSDAVRIDPRYGPFAAARGRSAEAPRALARAVEAWGESWVVEPEEWPAPPGLRVRQTAPLVQMVAEAPAPPEAGDDIVEPLSEDDLTAMTALALATEPGHWSSWTHRYGPFYAIREGGRLAAMAGERMRPAPGWAEVSAVCTWPEYRGRGYAGRLVRRVVAAFAERGDVPFLHSYAGNVGAIALYERLGFRTRRVMTLTVLGPA